MCRPGKRLPFSIVAEIQKQHQAKLSKVYFHAGRANKKPDLSGYINAFFRLFPACSPRPGVTASGTLFQANLAILAAFRRAIIHLLISALFFPTNRRIYARCCFGVHVLSSGFFGGRYDRKCSSLHITAASVALVQLLRNLSTPTWKSGTVSATKRFN